MAASAGAAGPARDLVELPKRYTQELDLVGLLGKYIGKAYSSGARRELDESLRDLQQQRIDMAMSNEFSDVVVSGVWRYHAQLAFVERRFPISPQSVKIPFEWGAAFEPARRLTGASINLERVSVLWNIAQLYSQAAAKQDRSTVDGIKAASNYLQLAAAVLQHASHASSGVPDRLLSWEVSAEGLRSTKAVLLAQAQGCFYEKAAKDSVSDSVLARLAMAAHNLFAEALTLSEAYRPAKNAWSSFIATNAAFFAARAAYRQGKSLAEQLERERRGFGEQIGWYRTAVGSCEDAVRAASAGGAVTKEGCLPRVQAFAAVCRGALEDVERDNRLIYMEAPVQVELSSIPAALLANPAALPAAAEADPDADLFARLEQSVENKSSCTIQ